MRVQPIQGAGTIAASTGGATESVSRAVAAFIGNTSAQEQMPVPNPNNVSAEDMSAILPNVKVAAEEVVEEQPAEVVELKKQETDPALSRQFAQLARQERALRAKAQAQEQAINAREEALKAREAALTSKDAEYSTGYVSKDQLKRNALQVLSDAGVSYDELTQQLLNQQTMDPRTESMIGRLEAKIAQLEKANEQSSKSQIEQQQASYQAAVSQIRNDVKNLVSQDDNFETIRATNSVNDVVELIEENYKRNNTIMSVEEAADQVEQYLVDEALKLARLKKVQGRLQPQATARVQPAPEVQTRQDKAQTQPMRTLTNANSSARQLSARERAILAFKGELK